MYFCYRSIDVQTHLTKVYRLLSLFILASVLGAAIQIKMLLLTESVVWCVVGLLALMVSMACVPKNRFFTRIALYMAFGLFQGILIGPLVGQAVDIDPQIVRGALALTLCVFVSFSTLAMMTRRKTYLYLGSLLNSFCMFLLVMSIFPVSFGYELSLYGGLVMFIGYVFFDTQQIIKRVERSGLQGTDYVSYAFELYIDFISIFVRILNIIMRSKEKREAADRKRKTKSHKDRK